MGCVLIVFQANSEAMEQLALAAAVGAVEAGGAIRLRRLAAADAPELAHKSYGRLQADDLRWADVIAAGLEDVEPKLDDLGPFFEMLGEVDLSGKRGWSFGPGGPDAAATEAQTRVEAELQRAGAGLMRVGVSAGSGDPVARMKEWGAGGLRPTSQSRDVGHPERPRSQNLDVGHPGGGFASGVTEGVLRRRCILSRCRDILCRRRRAYE